MHRGTKNTVVLALTKWFQKGHKSKVVDGKRIFPPEEERDKDAKKIRREIRRLEPPMSESMEDWLDGLLLYGEADWFLAVMGSMSDGDLHEELVRLAQVEPERRVSTVRLLHSTPWMAAFHRFRGRGRPWWSQAFRWMVAAGFAYALWWLLTWPYRGIEGAMRFFMERSHMEPETINLWAPQVMKLLLLILVLYAIYGIFFKKSPEEREVTVKATESDDDTASETTVVNKKEEKKTTTKPVDWGFVGKAAVVVVAALIVLWAISQMNIGVASTNGNSRASCQFGTSHLPDEVGCLVDITLPKDETPVCTQNCSEADKNRYLTGRCPQCRSTIAVQVGPDGWPTEVRAYTRGTEGSEPDKDMCARANEGWMAHARWERTGSAYFFYLRRSC